MNKFSRFLLLESSEPAKFREEKILECRLHCLTIDGATTKLLESVRCERHDVRLNNVITKNFNDFIS